MITNNIIRVGEIYDVNPKKYTARVYFADSDSVSGDLPIGVISTRNRRYDLPNKNDQCWCAFIAPSLSDGVIFAITYNDVDLPPCSDENVKSTTYPDGTVVSYDSEKHKLIIDCVGDVTINAEVIKLNGDLIINNKPWLEHQHKAGKLLDGDSKPVSGTSGDGVVG